MKKLFLIILILLLPLAFFFVWQFFKELYNYQSLKVKVPISVNEWRLDEVGNNKFKIVASYQYKFEKEIFHEKRAFRKIFINSDAALLYLKQQANEDLFVWVDPFKPKKSSLEKIFPIRQCINSILAIAIFIYFLVFKYYLHERFPE